MERVSSGDETLGKCGSGSGSLGPGRNRAMESDNVFSPPGVTDTRLVVTPIILAIDTVWAMEPSPNSAKGQISI
jgi:hypothetical protein